VSGSSPGAMSQGQSADDKFEKYCQLTPSEKYKVRPMEPKYVAVKGSRGVEVRCCTYVHGPIKKAHDARNSKDPNDHLMSHQPRLALENRVCDL